MKVKQEFSRILEEELDGMRFRRRGTNWYRLGQEIYSIVNIQSSRWDSLFYVNLGFAPAGDVPGGWLAESKCMLRFRLEAIKRVRPDSLRLLDDSVISERVDQHWRSAVRAGLVLPIVETLKRADSVEGLKGLLETEISDRVMIHRDMRRFLALPE
ncbi:DUF4304 domain-containing protein [Verrucosispora sp. WMMC514]|uniref:DUF4304 domain-containing protein n=1 Tax=Verrucosispora sp. WMMC514 TaxID=3015156 RepID=UPI00248AA091|nr:DUF4304 domain-containing protein [Verrucosispora sp. WMMC514]WBB93339.1 DUF4304 domain-containing protein [Verrucosispora sp. WMMC514]